jgi:uncharacterized membrane protein YraQ (UPF0718 family)
MTPAIVSETTAAAGKAFNWKTVLFVLVLTVIVMLLMGYIMRQTVTLKDSDGNVVSTGEIKNSLKLKLSQN